MLNPKNMPGAGSMADTMEFMRKMWGSMGSSSMGIPTLSVEEINKKISDLKTVASWLELNMNMLRATIQTLEVQSATLSTLQAMGAILTPQDDAAKASKPAAGAAFGFPAWPPKAEKKAEKTAEKSATESAAEKSAAKTTSTSPWAAQPSVSEQEDSDASDDDAPEDAQNKNAGSANAGNPGQADQQQAPFQAAMGNPNAWWNLLQEQFHQAVGSVLADTPPAVKKTSKASATANLKKTTKPKAATKAGTRVKTPVVQSRKSKPAPRKPKSP